MRSNELRDDGASLTTFEDLAPMVLFFYVLYGICLANGAALRDLISDLSLGHWAALWNSEGRDSSRILAAQRVETLATAMQQSNLVIRASDGTQLC